MKEIEIEWCPTKEMVADYMTKPLQGSHFRRLRDLIMGMTKVEKSKIPSKNSYDPIKNTCWDRDVDTLSTLGSLFSLPLTPCVVRVGDRSLTGYEPERFAF